MLVELRTADDVRLVGARFAPAGAPRASVVLVHGFAATAKEDRVIALSTALTAAGHEVLVYDSRGHGASGGEATLGALERLDVAAAVDEVRTGDRPVVVVGASAGAIGALRYVASGLGGVAGVVTVSCPSRWRLPMNARGLLSALLTQTPPGRWFARERMGVRIAASIDRGEPPVELLARVRAPVAVLHGLADPFISASDAEELYAAARGPRHLDLVVGLGHAYEAPAITPIVDAVDWALRR